MKLFIFTLLFVVMIGLTTFAKEETKLEDLVQETLSNNPEIKAARSRWEASTKRPSQEGSLPNPVIGGRFKNVGFTDITQGNDPRTDIQVFVNQEIPFPGKLSSKTKIAEEQADAQRWMSDAATYKVIADLKEAYYKWFLINKSLEITAENKQLLQDFVKVAEVKYEVGSGIQQDVLKAQVELSTFIERIELLKKKEEIIKTRIKTILNRSPGSDIGNPVEDLKIAELEYSQNQIKEIIHERSPELNARNELIDSSVEALNLAKKQYMPDFIVNGTYFNRDGGSGNLDDLWEVGVGLRLPLYFWRKEKFGVEEAAIKLSENKQNYEISKNNLYFRADDYYFSAKTAQNLIDLYKSGIIPQSRLSLESAISSYQVGDVDFLTLLNNLVTLFNFEIEYYRHISDYQIAVARLEEILSLQVTGSSINETEINNTFESDDQEINNE